MATIRASVQKLHAASCRTVPANKTAKDNLRHFDRANSEFPEMRPKLSTQGKLKVPEIPIAAAPTTHHGAWSHQMSVVLVTRSRKTYELACTLELSNGGSTAALHIGQGASIQAHYTIISRVRSVIPPGGLDVIRTCAGRDALQDALQDALPRDPGLHVSSHSVGSSPAR